jgi:hypothetical protein
MDAISAIVMKNVMPTECGRCKSKAVKISRCGKCLNASYCSRQCQKLSWVSHKLVCREPTDLIPGDIVQIVGLPDLPDNKRYFEVKRGNRAGKVSLCKIGGFPEFEIAIENMKRVVNKEQVPLY